MPAPEISVYRPEKALWPAPANSFLLKDARGGALIDAGCGYAERYGQLKRFLADNGLEPRDIHTVVLSHAHPDHIGAVPFLLEEADPSVRIVAHSIEAPLAAEPQLLNKTFDMCHIKDYYLERLEGVQPAGIIEYFSAMCPMSAVEVTDTVEDGDVLRLGERDLEVVLTPGHAPGHIALFDRRDGTLLSGDLVGAIVAWYCPSGGGAQAYLDSLDRLESLGASRILPSHGEPISDVGLAIDATREFITAREVRILDLLEAGPMSLLELTDELFTSPGPRMFPGLQVTDSHLNKLEKEGLVRRESRGEMPFFIRLRL